MEKSAATALLSDLENQYKSSNERQFRELGVRGVMPTRGEKEKPHRNAVYNSSFELLETGGTGSAVFDFQ